jgi:Protein of unknown function (DUF3048) N-terminal domain/Protein of unknown function (DUF3048) C-terminal domain
VPQRPALAMKVDNYPAARPQSGLDKADVVFEEPVEGMITRLVAVFQCQEASSVGPLRSARAVDAQILDQLSDPLFVHAGGITPVLDLLAQAHLTDENVFSHYSIVTLNPDRVAPYSTYSSTSDGWGLDPSNTTPPAPIFTYGSNPPPGTPVTSVHIPFSSTNDVNWTWDSAADRWALAYSGEPATVAGGGRITTTNVVVQTVHVTFGPWLENSEGGLEVQAQMTGSGPLEVFRDGQEITGSWQRVSLTSPTTLTAANGTVIPLAPGPTWVEIVPTTVTVTAS